jgi:hypothetical protein
MGAAIHLPGGHSMVADPQGPNRVTKAIKLSLTEDEAEMIVDALEADMEGYLESAKEARGNNNREDVKTFTEAAERIGAMITKLRALLD